MTRLTISIFRHLCFSFLSLLFFVFSSKAQETINLKGIIVNQETKLPVPFVNISVYGSAKGTSSGSDGRFEIRVPSNKEVELILSHINFIRKEQPITSCPDPEQITIFLQPKTASLKDVVISAALYDQKSELLSKPAMVIRQKNISDQMMSNLTDVLAEKPGISQVWEYHSPIILRGLNSKRIIIMQDENRKIGDFPGGYFGQDMNIYGVQRIEIIKGPGSVIYGGGAISGIINLIGEDLLQKPDGTHAKVLTAYGSNNNEFLEVFRACHKKKNFAIAANGRYRKTGNMTYGNGKEAENSDVQDRDMELQSALKISEKHILNANIDYHCGDWGKPRGFNGPSKYFTEIRNEEESFRAALNYNIDFLKKGESLAFNIYYDQGHRDYFQSKYNTITELKSTLDLVHYKHKYGGGRLFAHLKPSENNVLTVGTDAYIYRLDSPGEIIDYYNDTRGTVEGSKGAGQQNAGFFVNDEWDISEKYRLIAGLRFDLASVTEGENQRTEDRNAFSGNMGVVYSPSQIHHISLNFGRAFRMPSTEELFTRVISCKGTKEGNPELKPEYSRGIDLGFKGENTAGNFQYDLALFYNILDNFIHETASPKEDVDFTFANSDARIYGGEVSLHYRIHSLLAASDAIDVDLGAAYVYGTDESVPEDDAPLFGIPPFKVNAGLNYHGLMNHAWITGYKIRLFAEHATAQNRVAEIPEGTDGGPWGYVPSDPYTKLNFSIHLNSNALPLRPKIRFVVSNLLNNDYKPFGSYIPAMGRNFKIVLILSL